LLLAMRPKPEAEQEVEILRPAGLPGISSGGATDTQPPTHEVPPPDDVPFVDDYDLPGGEHPDDVLTTGNGEGLSAGTLAIWGGAALLIVGGLGYVLYDWMKGKEAVPAGPAPMPPGPAPMAGPMQNPRKKKGRYSAKRSAKRSKRKAGKRSPRQYSLPDPRDEGMMVVHTSPQPGEYAVTLGLRVGDPDFQLSEMLENIAESMSGRYWAGQYMPAIGVQAKKYLFLDKNVANAFVFQAQQALLGEGLTAERDFKVFAPKPATAVKHSSMWKKVDV